MDRSWISKLADPEDWLKGRASHRRDWQNWQDRDDDVTFSFYLLYLERYRAHPLAADSFRAISRDIVTKSIWSTVTGKADWANCDLQLSFSGVAHRNRGINRRYVCVLQSGLTPLHVASFMGCMNIVIFLLQHEANPDVPTVRGETPLHLAARANQTDIIRILLRNGAKVDARARVSKACLRHPTNRVTSRVTLFSTTTTTTTSFSHLATFDPRPALLARLITRGPREYSLPLLPTEGEN